MDEGLRGKGAPIAGGAPSQRVPDGKVTHMARPTKAQIALAEAIDAHLKRIEALDPDGGPFWEAGAFATANGVRVQYKLGRGYDLLRTPDAERYLAALDAGYEGMGFAGALDAWEASKR